MGLRAGRGAQFAIVLKRREIFFTAREFEYVLQNIRSHLIGKGECVSEIGKAEIKAEEDSVWRLTSSWVFLGGLVTGGQACAGPTFGLHSSVESVCVAGCE